MVLKKNREYAMDKKIIRQMLIDAKSDASENI